MCECDNGRFARTTNPREVPEAQAIIRRLCQLHAKVAMAIDPGGDHAADCFCGESGFWPLLAPHYFRNDGEAVAFIETAVREKLEGLA